MAKANQAYNEGDYQQAAQIYESLLKQSPGGYLYFNLGNCYFKQGRLGQAMIAYRRAERFTPRFENLAANLKYSRQQAKDKIEDKGYSQLLDSIFFWYPLFSLSELAVVFLILNTILFLIAILRLYVKTDTLRWVFFAALAVYLAAAATTGVRFYNERFRQEGVVTADEVWVRSGDGINNVVLFALHEGAEFEVEEVKGDWLKISLADGNRGWTQRIGVEII